MLLFFTLFQLPCSQLSITWVSSFSRQTYSTLDLIICCPSGMSLVRRKAFETKRFCGDKSWYFVKASHLYIIDEPKTFTKRFDFSFLIRFFHHLQFGCLRASSVNKCSLRNRHIMLGKRHLRLYHCFPSGVDTSQTLERKKDTFLFESIRQSRDLPNGSVILIYFSGIAIHLIDWFLRL